MNCPTCNKPLPVKKADVSNNFDTGAKYDRTVYHCEACDTWINVEVPKK